MLHQLKVWETALLTLKTNHVFFFIIFKQCLLGLLHNNAQ